MCRDTCRDMCICMCRDMCIDMPIDMYSVTCAVDEDQSWRGNVIKI